MTGFLWIQRPDLFFVLPNLLSAFFKKEHFRIFGLGQDVNLHNVSTTINCFCILLGLYSVHILQKKFSPRLIFDSFFPKTTKHNYFSALEIDLTEICPVCYEQFETQVKIKNEKFAPYLSKRLKNYLVQNALNLMITPCKHTYHSVCLLNSISYKAKCPMCREKLPNIF